MKTDLNKAKLIEYWLSSADDDFETMMTLFNSKRYHWSLFVGHLMIEKLLKAYYVKVNSDYPPFIPNAAQGCKQIRSFAKKTKFYRVIA